MVFQLLSSLPVGYMVLFCQKKLCSGVALSLPRDHVSFSKFIPSKALYGIPGIFLLLDMILPDIT